MVKKQFESNIFEKKLFTKNDHILLAISGGVDSMVLAHLLKSGNYNFSLAHCNFKLRGKESDGDEKFCNEFANKNGLKIHNIKLDVKKYCKTHKVSVQMAARALRYNWFYEIIEKEKLNYLITAHHANDVIETVLINLLRGTGIQGLGGIVEKNRLTVRPLLQFTKQEIINYAKAHKIKFRIDQSNLEDKYTRNFLRLNVIPRLRKINNSIENTFIENSFRFSQEAGIVKDYLRKHSEHLIQKMDDYVLIDKIKLKNENYKETLIHFLLNPYGFSQTQEQNILKNIMDGKLSGKTFYATKYKLIIERNELIIYSRVSKKTEEIKIRSLTELKNVSLFKITEENQILNPTKNELYVDESKLIFPIKIRSKQTGDKFKPFGMTGTKLLSDFCKEKKLNYSQKNNVKLLVNGNNEIIWVIGYQSDDRYKINPDENKFLKIHWCE